MTAGEVTATTGYRRGELDGALASLTADGIVVQQETFRLVPSARERIRQEVQ